MLELLPGPAGLSDEEADAVTATAILVGTDAALPLLAQYVKHPAFPVRVNLMRAWGHFDPVAYANEVLAHVNSRDFFISVSSSEMLRALLHLGPRERLAFEGQHSLTDIMRVAPVGVRKIDISSNPVLEDLRLLATFGSLERVGLSMCAEIKDLYPLADLDLTELNLHDMGAVSGLDRLNTLQSLGVTSELPGGLRDLPQAAPLNRLRLGGSALRAGGLRGLLKWPTLTWLSLLEEVEVLAAEDWFELSTHEGLSELALDVQAADHCANATELPHVETLWVTNVQGFEDLSALGRLCPNLRTVSLATPHGIALDVSAYEKDFPGAEVVGRRVRPFAF
ncbi:hypothetical protein [Streptomyces bauhiniae]|uniref:hypothetical protein n=1 Tax=Streptomyces bauhiniae TaxID=2340725 RepID=UPI001EF19BCA|nr:hypothetical protein [Streptomyces bauhiniae]